MKLTILFILISICGYAQNTKPEIPDTTTVEKTARVVPIVEKNMIDRNNKINELNTQIQQLQKLNEDDYTAILQNGNIVRDSIVKGPSYRQGHLVFRMKKSKPKKP